MKIFTLIFFNALLSATAQTNIFIDFTNSSGDLVTNAEVSRVFANKIIYRTSSGGGTIRIESLPSTIQKQLNFDPYNAALADIKDQEIATRKKQALQEQKNQAAFQAKMQASRDQAIKNTTVIVGRVVQRLKEGLLISSTSGSTYSGYTPDSIYLEWTKTHTAEQRWENVADGMLLLKDYPREKALAEGDQFYTIAYPDGFFKYTTVNHAESTIHRYSSSVDASILDGMIDE